MGCGNSIVVPATIDKFSVGSYVRVLRYGRYVTYGTVTYIHDKGFSIYTISGNQYSYEYKHFDISVRLINDDRVNELDPNSLFINFMVRVRGKFNDENTRIEYLINDLGYSELQAHVIKNEYLRRSREVI